MTVTIDKTSLLSELNSAVEKARQGMGFVAFVTKCCKVGIYNPRIVDKFTPSQLLELSEHMRSDRDRLFEVAGLVMMKERYLLSDKDNPWCKEYLQEVFMATALVLASVSPPSIAVTHAKVYYDAISTGKISLATPFLANARKAGSHNSTASCFVTKVEDSLDSIANSWKNAAHISSYGGGLGLSLSSIRAEGSDVRGYDGVSKGIPSWMSILNSIACAVDQAGSRKAAITVAVEAHHADVIEVIRTRKETEFVVGDDRKRSPELFPQVVIHDVFMEQVEEDGDWFLFDPHELLTHGIDLTNTNGDQYREQYWKSVELGKNGKLRVFREMKARRLIREIVESYVETGFPYIFFKDAANRLHHGSGQVYSANLCMEGPTMMLTSRGNRRLDEIEGRVIKAWNGNQFTEVQVTKTGIDEELYEVVTTSGVPLRCNLSHKWILENGERVETSQLKNGDVLYQTELPRLNSGHLKWEDDNRFPLLGLRMVDNPNVSPDASVLRNLRRNFYTEEAVLSLLDYVSKGKTTRGFLGDQEAICIDMDPLVCEAFYYALMGLGAACQCKFGRLVIGELSIYKLYQIGGPFTITDYNDLLTSQGIDPLSHIEKFQNSKPIKIKVVRVNQLHERTSVYCATEKYQNALVFNGQLAGNCVESFTPFDDFLIHVCNLVSINVYAARPENVGKYAELSVRMLNAVIELTNDNLLPGARAHNLMYRSIGIGMMGIADVLAEKKLSWRDPETAKYVGRLTEDIAYHSLKASVSLATNYPIRVFKDPDSSWKDGKMYGRDIEWFEENSYNPSRWKTIQERVIKQPPMNCYLLSVAPNTSTARLWGVSASWFPRIRLEYQYIWHKTSIPIRPPVDGENKWHYSLDSTLDQHYKIAVAAEIQKWVDQGVSMELVCNLNEGIYDKIPTRKLYDWIMDAWKKGLKSIYYVSILQLYSDDPSGSLPQKVECESCAG